MQPKFRESPNKIWSDTLQNLRFQDPESPVAKLVRNPYYRETEPTHWWNSTLEADLVFGKRFGVKLQRLEVTLGVCAWAYMNSIQVVTQENAITGQPSLGLGRRRNHHWH